tara:strand:+ start:189 stop:647 length:459 start_codon:yes stop_codon:yes gene_type:complete
MKKIIFINFFILLIFITSCGYTPIFSNKNINFTIADIELTGNNKLNKILNNKLNIYKNLNSEKKYYLKINTDVNKKISSKDSKGNAKTFEITISTNTSIQDEKGNIKEKLFIKSVNYKNNNNKFDLKKYENRTSEALVNKISEEIIIYLQTI